MFQIEESGVLDQWQEIVETISRVLGVPAAVITRVHLPMIQVLRSNRHPGNPYSEGLEVEIRSHFCEAVVKGRTRVHVRDARESDRWQNAPEIEHGLVSYLGYPIRLPNGEIFGTLCVLDTRGNDYGPDQDSLLSQFRGMVEAHLLLLHQNQELRERMREIRQLRGIIPICMKCRRVRGDEDFWERVEEYITRHSNLDFSHGLCPHCAQEHYGEYMTEARA